MSGFKVINEHLRNLDQTAVDSEARYLREAIKRSGSIFSPVRSEARAKDQRRNAEANLRVGMISRQVTHSDDNNDKELPELEKYSPILKCEKRSLEPYYKILVASNPDRIDSQRNLLFQQIDRLCLDGSNLICVNELGYPAFLNTKKNLNGVEPQALMKQKDKDFRLKVQEISNRYNTIIVCGTYHNPEDYHNKAVIFFPKLANSIEHLKLTSAKSENVGEIIRVPSNRNFPVYDTIYGNICVLICSDAFDLNMFFRNIKMTDGRAFEDNIDIIFVPSFTEVSLEASCQALSYFSKSVVIYVNTQLSVYNAVFVGGQRLSQLGNEPTRVVDIPWERRKDCLQKAEEQRRTGLFTNLVGSAVERPRR
jgi:hypothetical protein